MRIKEYLREYGVYSLDKNGNFLTLSSTNSPGGDQTIRPENLNKIISNESVYSVLLLTGGLTPTEVLCHELLSRLYSVKSELNLLVAVCPVERKKLMVATAMRTEYQRLWFSVTATSMVNDLMQLQGFYPKEKYRKNINIYDYSLALTKLISSMDLSDVQCMISVNCSKKISTTLIPADFLRVALTTRNGIEVSILNERFKWHG